MLSLVTESPRLAKLTLAAGSHNDNIDFIHYLGQTRGPQSKPGEACKKLHSAFERIGNLLFLPSLNNESDLFYLYNRVDFVTFSLFKSVNQ